MPSLERSVKLAVKQTTSAQNIREENVDCQYDVPQLIQAKKITSSLQLMALASSQNREGKTDLAEFICNRGSKVIDECLSIAHELAFAEEKFARMKNNRIKILEEMKEGNCADECKGKWIQAATDLLQRNEIDIQLTVCFNAVRENIETYLSTAQPTAARHSSCRPLRKYTVPFVIPLLVHLLGLEERRPR